MRHARTAGAAKRRQPRWPAAHVPQDCHAMCHSMLCMLCPCLAGFQRRRRPLRAAIAAAWRHRRAAAAAVDSSPVRAVPGHTARVEGEQRGRIVGRQCRRWSGPAALSPPLRSALSVLGILSGRRQARGSASSCSRRCGASSKASARPTRVRQPTCSAGTNARIMSLACPHSTLPSGLKAVLPDRWFIVYGFAPHTASVAAGGRSSPELE